MSTKVWALNSETGEVLNVNHVDKTYKGKMVCLDENCGEVLNICIGEKNRPYFSHQKNTTCRGGSTETLLHMLGKQILCKCEMFTLPEEYVIFRKKKVVFSAKHNVMIKEVEPFDMLSDKFKTGVKMTDYNGFSFYVELCAKDLGTSRKRLYEKNGCTVVAVDLHKFTRDADSIDEDKLTKFICNGTGIKTYITSPSIHIVECEISKSLFCSNGDYIACPAYNFEEIVEKTNCSSCPYYDYTTRQDGAIHCYGLGYYSEVIDFKSISEVDMRRERYSNLVPEPVWGVDRFAHRAIFGVCSSCGGNYELRRGTDSRQIKGIQTIGRKTDFAYLVCKDCGRVMTITCPTCDSPMELRTNRRTGEVFLGCSGYSSIGCRASLTVFNGEPCATNFANQLLCIGDLTEFLEHPERARRKLYSLRDK